MRSEVRDQRSEIRGHHSPLTTHHSPHRGSLAVAAVVSLTVLLGVLALAIDWAYVNMAHVELSRAADAAALAAAQALIPEHQLVAPCDISETRQSAITAACHCARLNWTAGEPTELGADSEETSDPDVRVGRLIRSPGCTGIFVESSAQPDTVQITARRTRARNNPLGLLLGSFLGVSWAEVVAQSQATLDDQIVGFSPVCGVPVPVVPLAILLSDPYCHRRDTWEEAITKRGGADCFGIDPATGQVVGRSDGIPELELIAGSDSTSDHGPSLALLDLGNGLDGRAIARQIRFGLGPSDLEQFNGSLRLDPSNRLAARGVFQMPNDVSAVLKQIRGERRVWCLYATGPSPKAGESKKITVVGFVGARVMNTRITEDGRVAIRVQPCFVVTRSAIAEPGSKSVPRNPYIRKLSLTG